MRGSWKQRATGAAAALALGLATIGSTIAPASAGMRMGGGGGHFGSMGGGHFGGMAGGRMWGGGHRYGGGYGRYGGYGYGGYGGGYGYSGYYAGGPWGYGYGCGPLALVTGGYGCPYAGYGY